MSDEPSHADDRPGNLHNNFFLSCFGEPQAMMKLMAELAPRPVSGLIEPESLERVDGSFVDQKMRSHHTDLLFRGRLKQGGGEVFVYLLAEHKSWSDPDILLQLLRYKCNIWATLDKKGGPLTPIIPVVFYHGERPWSVAPDFHGAVGSLNDALRPLVDQFHYILIDIGRIEDEALPEDLALRAQLAALKHSLRKDFLDVGFPLLARLLARSPDVVVWSVLYYILLQHPEIEEDEFDRMVIQHAPELKEKVMNGWFQEAFSNGKAEGEASGVVKGEARGLVKGKAETLLKFLTIRLGGDVPRAMEQRILKADCQTLDEWTDRIFRGAPPKDVIRH